jgi:hypothetical protein
LIEAYAITEIHKFLDCAYLIYNKLNLLWDPINSLYSLDNDDKYKYTLKDVGCVIAGLNSMRLFGEGGYKTEACDKLITFFNSSLNNSGLVQASFPPPTLDDWEGHKRCLINNRDSIINEDFCHSDIPQVFDVSTAPVFAKKFTFKPKKQKFKVNSDSFYSEYALFTVNELLCMNYPDIECFHKKILT